MTDLKAELEAYASTDEPPVRLEFDSVLTAARRARRGRRATAVVAMAAVMAVAAGVIPSLVRPNSPPPTAEAARPTAPPCLPNPNRAAKAHCAVEAALYPEFSPGSTVTRVTRLGDEAPDVQVFFGGWDASDSEGVGSVSVYINPATGPEPCTTYCTEQRAPNGDMVNIVRGPRPQGGAGDTVVAYHNGCRVAISTSNLVPVLNEEKVLIGDRVGRPEPPLNLDQMIRIASDHSLVF